MSAIRNSAQVNSKTKAFRENYDRIFKKKKKKPQSIKKRLSHLTIHV